MIIIDAGSGNTCKNDKAYIKRMIDELAKVDSKRVCCIKWQLFLSAGENIPLTHDCFDYAYRYAEVLGFKTTASVFDIDSLEFLMKYKTPFIKIANKPILYDTIMKDITVDTPVIVSWNKRRPQGINMKYMCCVSKYPAILIDYENQFSVEDLESGISDHTTDFKLYNKYKPKVYEVHYMLSDSTGLDAGKFSRTPEQLKELFK